MVQILIRRIGYAFVTLFFVSIICFIIIQLPPGDYADAYAAKRHAGGEIIREEEVEAIRHQLGLDRPMYIQYLNWMWGVVRGELGMSLEYKRPVSEVIAERLPLTLILAFSTMVFIYSVALSIGIFSAVRQYSAADHFFTVIGYIGLATPNFLLALLLMYASHKWFGQSVGGLFSLQFQDAPWSWARLMDMLSHLWVPVVVLGTAGTSFPGLSEFRTLMKYPVRIALNPIVSTLGWELTRVISGAPIVGVVLSLPDTGPLFLKSLLDQDTYLAGAMILIYCTLVIVGTFISDVLLIILDPRIRYERVT
ncbi:Dipeptide transport system permease protein DppB [subsurface metagenome]